jgi:hypothetical protein
MSEATTAARTWPPGLYACRACRARNLVINELTLGPPGCPFSAGHPACLGPFDASALDASDEAHERATVDACLSAAAAYREGEREVLRRAAAFDHAAAGTDAARRRAAVAAWTEACAARDRLGEAYDAAARAVWWRRR